MRSRRRWVIPVLVVLVVLAAVYAIRDGDNELDQARAECEARDGHTELLPASGLLYVCYEVTVLDDGWRLCNANDPWLQVRVETPPQSNYPCGNAGPRGAVEEAAVEEARRECEARNGHTEFLPVDDRYSCFEITVLDDGWRTCAWSVPYLTVITETTEPEYPCGTPGPEWPFVVDEAPAECESARDWYADYYRSVIDEMNRVVALVETPDAASVQAWLSRQVNSVAVGQEVAVLVDERRKPVEEKRLLVHDGVFASCSRPCSRVVPNQRPGGVLGRVRG